MIILKKTGIFYKSNITPEHKDDAYKQVNSIIPYLDVVINIDEDFTMRDFFKIIAIDEEAIEFVFSSYLGHHSLHPFIEEIYQDCMLDNKTEIKYIECSWVADQFDYRLFYEQNKDEPDIFNREIGKTIREPSDDDENEITICIDVHGVGLSSLEENGVACIMNGHDYTSYGIEFLPLHKIANLPIKLNTSFKMYDKNDIEQANLLISGKRNFTVFEIFSAILSEVTFCGTIEERNKTWKNVSDTVDEIKKNCHNADEDNKE